MSKTADHYDELSDRLAQGYNYVIYPPGAEPLYVRTVGACVTYARNLHSDEPPMEVHRIDKLIEQMTDDAYDRANPK